MICLITGSYPTLRENVPQKLSDSSGLSDNEAVPGVDYVGFFRVIGQPDSPREGLCRIITDYPTNRDWSRG
jgi:hypothetical protein